MNDQLPGLLRLRRAGLHHQGHRQAGYGRQAGSDGDGDLRPGRARKRDPMVSSFAMEKVAGRPATSQSIPPRQESSSPVRASVCALLCPRQHFRLGECDATVAPPGERPALSGQTREADSPFAWGKPMTSWKKQVRAEHAIYRRGTGSSIQGKILRDDVGEAPIGSRDCVQPAKTLRTRLNAEA